MSATTTKKRLRKYSPWVFSRGRLSCPHCQLNLQDVAQTCPGCGFNLAECQKSFPFAAPPLALIIDPSSILPTGIEKDLKKNYRKFRKCTPQVDISFCFVRLQAGSPLEEFAFWLHNTAPEAESGRAWQLLVVGDLTSGRLTLTSGYALEPFLKHELWEAALQEMAACFSDDEWKEGLNGFLTDARDLLSSAWHVAERRRQGDHRRRVTHSQALPDGQKQNTENASGRNAMKDPGAFPAGNYAPGPSSSPRRTERKYPRGSATS